MKKQASPDFVLAATVFKNGLPTEKQCDVCFAALINENSGDSSSSSINFKPSHSWKTDLPPKSLVLAQWYQESTKPVKLYRTEAGIKTGGVDRVLFRIPSGIRDYYLLQSSEQSIANVFIQNPIDNSGYLKIFRFGIIDKNFKYSRGDEVLLRNYNRSFRKDVAGKINDAYEGEDGYVIQLEGCREIPTGNSPNYWVFSF